MPQRLAERLSCTCDETQMASGDRVLTNASDTVAVFSAADAAGLYDVLNPWDPGRPGYRFYHELVMAADSVLDVAAAPAPCWPTPASTALAAG
jgi:hypothetical protein